MPEEQCAHKRDDQELFTQLASKVADSVEDQFGTVVGGNDFNAGRQAGFQVRQLGFHRLDRRQGIFARAQNDHAAGDLPFPIELGDATP